MWVQVHILYNEHYLHTAHSYKSKCNSLLFTMYNFCAFLTTQRVDVLQELLSLELVNLYLLNLCFF